MTDQQGANLGGGILVLLLFAAAVWGVFRLIARRAPVSPTGQPMMTAEQRAAARAAQQTEDAKRYRLTPINVPGVIVKKGEVFYWNRSNVEHLVEQVERGYVAGTRGVSVRVAKGVYVRAGGVRGHQTKSTHVGVGDVGTLLISNQRIVFQGARETVVIPIPKIVSIQPYTDGFGVARENSKLVVFRSGRAEDAIVVQRIIHGDTNTEVQQSPPASQADIDKIVAKGEEALRHATEQHERGELSDADLAQVQGNMRRIRATAEVAREQLTKLQGRAPSP